MVLHEGNTWVLGWGCPMGLHTLKSLLRVTLHHRHRSYRGCPSCGCLLRSVLGRSAPGPRGHLSQCPKTLSSVIPRGCSHFHVPGHVLTAGGREGVGTWTPGGVIVTEGTENSDRRGRDPLITPTPLEPAKRYPSGWGRGNRTALRSSTHAEGQRRRLVCPCPSLRIPCNSVFSAPLWKT